MARTRMRAEFSLSSGSLLLSGALAFCGPAVAQSLDATTFDEISVTAVRSEARALQPATILNEDYFKRTVPTDFNEVFRNVLGVGIRTNSRGEAVIRLRGSEERQSQVFIDGAPISVPWDGRADLSLFPASLIRRVSVIKSAAPIEYGANAVLGVVDISTQELDAAAGINTRSEFGNNGAYLFEGEAYLPLDGLDLQFGANHFHRDAISLPDEAPVPFDPQQSEGRTNTDLTSTSFFASAAVRRDWGSLRLSAFDIDADKGIAAAGHIDPAEGNPRFWRYPDWHMTQVSLAGDVNFSDTLSLRVNGWHQRFNQTIVSYRDVTYTQAQEQQDDTDRTVGGRLVLSKDWTAVTTRIVASLQQSTHTQNERDLIASVARPSEQFRQRLLSLGAEIDVPVSDTVKTSFAVAYDRAATPLTGGRPEQPALSKWAASGAVAWEAHRDLTITATLGQRTRFPTMRELYGTALGRFLLNPDLKPETALVGDLTAEWQPSDLPITVTVSPWFTRINDTLSRRTLTVEGVSLRQRFNLDGSKGYGVEASALWQVSDPLSLEANIFWQDLKADRDETGNRATLYQRPESQILLAANYTFTGGSNIRAELNHTGRAFDEEEDGTVVALPKSTELNIKFFIPVKETDYGTWQVYGALNNITDTVVLPQLGLPDAGRSFKLGIRLTGR